MVATRETDSHRLPAGWNGRGAAISSLGEHLHPQQILVGPDDFQKVILRFLIPKMINPVQKPICHVKYPGLGVLKQEDSFHGNVGLFYGKAKKRC